MASRRAAPVARFEEFLGLSELTWLWQFAMRSGPGFVRSQVVGHDHEGEDPNVRRSWVLYDVNEIQPFFAGRVLQYLPQLLDALGHVQFPVRDIELQVTASNDGEFFRPHTDSGQTVVHTREITFVYFCHREPRAFTGGELRVYDSVNPDASGAETDVHVIEPAQNTIVFFPSQYVHEVAPLSCPSREFVDSRLTFNGWLHR
jgi:Rps23 Pro-64 3,4-dihydroxylase Tpa1-like proline 4-hydroxylase